MTYNMTNLSAKEQKRLERMMEKATRPFYKKKRFILPVGLLAIILMANAGGSDNPQKGDAEKVTIAQASEVKTPINDPGISKTEFAQIQNGMTYDRVKKIIGSEGEMLSEVGQKGKQFYTVTYEWKGKSGFGSNANFIFQDGKLQSKAQFGL